MPKAGLECGPTKMTLVFLPFLSHFCACFWRLLSLNHILLLDTRQPISVITESAHAGFSTDSDKKPNWHNLLLADSDKIKLYSTSNIYFSRLYVPSRLYVRP